MSTLSWRSELQIEDAAAADIVPPVDADAPALALVEGLCQGDWLGLWEREAWKPARSNLNSARALPAFSPSWAEYTRQIFFFGHPNQHAANRESGNSRLTKFPLSSSGGGVSESSAHFSRVPALGLFPKKIETEK